MWSARFHIMRFAVSILVLLGVCSSTDTDFLEIARHCGQEIELNGKDRLNGFVTLLNEQPNVQVTSPCQVVLRVPDDLSLHIQLQAVNIPTCDAKLKLTNDESGFAETLFSSSPFFCAKNIDMKDPAVLSFEDYWTMYKFDLEFDKQTSLNGFNILLAYTIKPQNSHEPLNWPVLPPDVLSWVKPDRTQSAKTTPKATEPSTTQTAITTVRATEPPTATQVPNTTMHATEKLAEETTTKQVSTTMKATEPPTTQALTTAMKATQTMKASTPFTTTQAPTTTMESTETPTITQFPKSIMKATKSSITTETSTSTMKATDPPTIMRAPTSTLKETEPSTTTQAPTSKTMATKPPTTHAPTSTMKATKSSTTQIPTSTMEVTKPSTATQVTTTTEVSTTALKTTKSVWTTTVESLPTNARVPKIVQCSCHLGVVNGNEMVSINNHLPHLPKVISINVPAGKTCDMVSNKCVSYCKQNTTILLKASHIAGTPLFRNSSKSQQRIHDSAGDYLCDAYNKATPPSGLSVFVFSTLSACKTAPVRARLVDDDLCCVKSEGKTYKECDKDISFKCECSLGIHNGFQSRFYPDPKIAPTSLALTTRADTLCDSKEKMCRDACFNNTQYTVLNYRVPQNFMKRLLLRPTSPGYRTNIIGERVCQKVGSADYQAAFKLGLYSKVANCGSNYNLVQNVNKGETFCCKNYTTDKCTGNTIQRLTTPRRTTYKPLKTTRPNKPVKTTPNWMKSTIKKVNLEEVMCSCWAYSTHNNNPLKLDYHVMPWLSNASITLIRPAVKQQCSRNKADCRKHCAKVVGATYWAAVGGFYNENRTIANAIAENTCKSLKIDLKIQRAEINLELHGIINSPTCPSQIVNVMKLFPQVCCGFSSGKLKRVPCPATTTTRPRTTRPRTTPRRFTVTPDRCTCYAVVNSEKHGFQNFPIDQIITSTSMRVYRGTVSECNRKMDSCLSYCAKQAGMVRDNNEDFIAFTGGNDDIFDRIGDNTCKQMSTSLFTQYQHSALELHSKLETTRCKQTHLDMVTEITDNFCCTDYSFVKHQDHECEKAGLPAHKQQQCDCFLTLQYEDSDRALRNFNFSHISTEFKARPRVSHEKNVCNDEVEQACVDACHAAAEKHSLTDEFGEEVIQTQWGKMSWGDAVCTKLGFNTSRKAKVLIRARPTRCGIWMIDGETIDNDFCCRGNRIARYSLPCSIVGGGSVG